MAISFLTLTTVEEVRAAIGIDSTDIPDSMITDMRPEDDLKLDLLEWVPTYQTVISEGLSGSPTTAQEQKYLLLKVYAKYFVAALVASAGSNSILQKRSDGSNEGQRFTNVSIKDLVTELRARAKTAQNSLAELIDSASTTSYSIFGVVSPDYDPVTNE